MSGILSNVLDGASTVYKESIPLSADDKARIQREDNEKVFKRDVHELLIASASSYRTIDDGLLEAYADGAVFRFKHLQVLRFLACCAADEDGSFERYTRETLRYLQVVCRLQREHLRRVKARRATDSL